MVSPAQFVQEVLLTRVLVQIQMLLAAVLLPVQMMLQSRQRTSKEAPTGNVITRSELLLMKPRRQEHERPMEAGRLPVVAAVSDLPRGAAAAVKKRQRPSSPAVAQVDAATPAAAAAPPAVERAADAAPPKPRAPPTSAARPQEELDFERRVSAARQALVALGHDAGPEAEGILRELAELSARALSAERMLAEAAARAPHPESEAFRWHEVAQTTLRWSLAEVQKRKRAIEVQLLELAARAPPAAAPPPPGAPEEAPGPDRSMRQDLESLRQYDASRVLIVRRIKRLGWNSAGIVRAYIEQFGAVTDVLICHSMTKPNPKRPGGRSRPAALGFVVMGSAAAASEVLAEGPEHVANGVIFEVKAFDPFEGDAVLEAAGGSDA